ncbi:unnamed protein product, partial [Coregonus sp. 'balchen']
RPWPSDHVAGFLPQHGGFRDHFVATPEPKYCCEACRLVLCNPRQTECGHRFCETCISEQLREIMTLKVYCRSEKNGCKEQIRLQQVMDHLNVCLYFEVPCPLGKCKEKMMRKDISEHLSRKCKHRETTCEFCMQKMAMTELQKHKETVCPSFPVACPNHCTFPSILRSELTSHQHECPKAQVTCSFIRFGCNFKGLNQDMRDHESSFASEHLRLMATRNTTLEAKVEDVKGELLERYKVLPGLSSRLSETLSQYEEMREKNRQLDQKLNTMQ